MQPLSCPIPSNINPLQSNGFLFTVTKLPEVSFFCQEASLPELSLPSAVVESRLATMPHAGDKLQFTDLTVSFLVDEEMKNYISVHNWLIGLGFPESTEQYKNFISGRTNPAVLGAASAAYSAGILQVLNSSNAAVKTIEFVDLVPISLGSLQLQSTTTETTYLTATASFAYTYYHFD